MKIEIVTVITQGGSKVTRHSMFKNRITFMADSSNNTDKLTQLYDRVFASAPDTQDI